VSAVPSVVVLEIPARRDHLALVRLVVSGVAAIERIVPERRLEDLRLAVSEACANAVDAQLAAGVEAPLEVRIEAADAALAVTVTDHAGGFEPEAVDPIPVPTDPQRLRHERGLGIPLMHSLVDEVSFARVDGGTAVRLVIRAAATG
jgi:serine/threonine-protein kinase RsbW